MQQTDLSLYYPKKSLGELTKQQLVEEVRARIEENMKLTERISLLESKLKEYTDAIFGSGTIAAVL